MRFYCVKPPDFSFALEVTKPMFKSFKKYTCIIAINNIYFFVLFFSSFDVCHYISMHYVNVDCNI